MKRKHFWMSTAVATMIAGGALAQDTPAPETGVAEGGAETAMLAPTFTSIEAMTVDDMIGMYVYDPQGDQISEIDYVIAGLGGPEAVLGIGGFLGLGEYTVALPLDQFDLGEDGASLRLNTDKETLKSYPEIDESAIESLPGETSIGALLDAAGGGDSAPSGDGAAAEGDAMPDDTATDDDAAADESDMPDDTASEETTAQ